MDLKSTEKLCREQLSSSEQVNIIKLSYESYFQQSLEDMASVESINFNINNETKKFINTITLLKSNFSKSVEDAEESEKLKHTFGTTIKNWFIKIWSFIVAIFDKIVAIVVNMVKSLILYIQKKRLSKNAIYVKINNTFNNLYKTEKIKEIQNYLIENNSKIKSYRLVNDSSNNHNTATFSDVSAALNNEDLKQFLKNNDIILKNSKSIFNIESLKEFLSTEIIPGKDSEVKLSNLEKAVDILTSQAILSGEVSPIHQKVDPTINRYSDMIASGNTKTVANMLTYRVDKIEFETIDTIGFLGADPHMDLSNIIFSTLARYNHDSELVLNKGGYIDVINNIMNKYKLVAANDAKHIKSISKYITDQLNKITAVNTTVEEQKLQHSIKRFTNLIVKVKSIKTEFVAFRQRLTGNILTLFTMEDNCIRQMIKALDLSELKIQNATKSNMVKLNNNENTYKDDYSENIVDSNKMKEYEALLSEGYDDDEAIESFNFIKNKKDKKNKNDEETSESDDDKKEKRKDKLDELALKGLNIAEKTINKKAKKNNIDLNKIH